MPSYIPKNRKTKQEYEPIQAKDVKDAKLVWNTQFEGFTGKYDFIEVPEHKVPTQVQRQERKAPNLDE